jgi:hypothetical protein
LAPEFGDGGGGSAIGPGSGNFWSDQYRSEYGNYMLGNKSSFNKMYGPGAYDIARGLASNSALQNSWRQGMISIEKIRANGGYWKTTTYTLNSPTVYDHDGNLIIASLPTLVVFNKFIHISTEKGVPSGQEGGILDKGLDYAGRTNDGVDAFAKTLVTNGLTAVMVNGGKIIGRYSEPAGVVISAGQVFNGVRKDGYQFGYNAQKATAGAVGGTVAAWAGFQAGAWAGFESGFAIGLCFEGVGAIPGAVIGGIVGGFGGAFGGAYGGSKLGESLISNKAQ